MRTEAPVPCALTQDAIKWRSMDDPMIEIVKAMGIKVLVWNEPDLDPYHIGAGRLTTYGAWCEGGSQPSMGLFVAHWGGGFDDSTWEEPNGANMPDWWFADDDHEQPLNPVRWAFACGPEYTEGEQNQIIVNRTNNVDQLDDLDEPEAETLVSELELAPDTRTADKIDGFDRDDLGESPDH